MRIGDQELGELLEARGFVNERSRDVVITMFRASLAHDDVAATAEASLWLAAKCLRMLAQDENLPFDELYVEACGLAARQTQDKKVVVLADRRDTEG